MGACWSNEGLHCCRTVNTKTEEFMKQSGERALFSQVDRMLVRLDYSGERLKKGKDVEPIAKNVSYEQQPRKPS